MFNGVLPFNRKEESHGKLLKASKIADKITASKVLKAREWSNVPLALIKDMIQDLSAVLNLIHVSTRWDNSSFLLYFGIAAS